MKSNVERLILVFVGVFVLAIVAVVALLLTFWPVLASLAL